MALCRQAFRMGERPSAPKHGYGRWLAFPPSSFTHPGVISCHVNQYLSLSAVCAVPAGPLPECPRQESSSGSSSVSTVEFLKGVPPPGDMSRAPSRSGKTLKHITTHDGELQEGERKRLSGGVKPKRASCNSLRYQIL